MVELRAISPDATPEEVAAIVAALAEVERQRRTQAAASVGDGQRLDHWRVAGRLANRRAAMTRGPWRLSGRIQPRPRAS